MSKRISPFLTKRKRSPGSPVKGDPQRHLVYHMERSITGWAIYAHVELDDLQTIADYVCRKFRVRRVGVDIVNEPCRVFGYCKDYTIHLNQDFHGDNTSVLAHELAHYVTYQREGDGVETHGPEFVAYYGEILDMLNLFPLEEFYNLCDRHKVAYGEYI